MMISLRCIDNFNYLLYIIDNFKEEKTMKNASNITNLNIRIDSTLKQESDVLFKSLGLNMSTAINMFLTKCVNTSSIPFEVSIPKSSKSLKKALKESDYIAKHPEKYKGYHTIDELFEALDNED